MNIEEILKTDYSGKFIYRSEWDKYTPHKAVKLNLTNSDLVYIQDDGNYEIMQYDYKFSLYEIMCNDWEFYLES